MIKLTIEVDVEKVSLRVHGLIFLVSLAQLILEVIMLAT